MSLSESADSSNVPSNGDDVIGDTAVEITRAWVGSRSKVGRGVEVAAAFKFSTHMGTAEGYLGYNPQSTLQTIPYLIPSRLCIVPLNA